MHDEDVRMIERARGASLLFKAMQPIGIGRESRRQNLDRNIAAQSGIARAIHLAHSARTQRRHDFVWAKSCTWRDAHFFKSAVQLTTSASGAAFPSLVVSTR